MSDWILVPCLVTLRAEFDAVAPKRARGSDGSIGDSNHTSASDHTPDEDSDILRDHDADDKNEVHALDIDSSGPWPTSGWFNDNVLSLVAREKAEYESATAVGRLKYVIWARRIASRSWGWTWRSYTGADPHENHAHFSARYLTSTEADTRPWGVEEDTMPTADEIAQAVASKLHADLRDAKSGLYSSLTARVTAGTAAAVGKGGPADLTGLPKETAAAVLTALGNAAATPAQVAAALAPVLGANGPAVGRILAGL